MTSRILIIAFALILSGCMTTTTRPPEGKALLQGTDTATERVLIRQIDDGELLWVGNYQMRTTAVIEPGAHDVSVMCEFRHNWGNVIVPGDVKIDVEAGKTYRLSGTQNDRVCNVDVDGN